ncbi:MAG: hypothetical protein ACQKBT_05590 [Puniceicoccales bacterium]
MTSTRSTSQDARSRSSIEWIECVTPLGNSSENAEKLCADAVSLRPGPVLGERWDSDLVPLSLFGQLEPTIPTSWGTILDRLLTRVPDAPWGSLRCPVIFCSSNFGVGHVLSLRKTGDRRHETFGTPQRSIQWICERYGWGEHRQILSHACVSAQLGLNLAHEWVSSGKVDRVLVFSFDFLSAFVTGGFHALRILNGTQPQPFTEREIGSIGLGEGAAAAVISRDQGEWTLSHPSLYNEMYHMTANAPDGSGFSELFSRLSEAIAGNRLWVKGHGTGTLDAGRMEATQIAQQLPDSPLISWKGSLGHTLGSCALVELAIALRAMETGTIPGTVGAGDKPMTDSVALHPFSSKSFDGLLSLSNAFGGAHAACLIRHA